MADKMWVVVMFDLPVVTKKQRRDATAYRNILLDLGFTMLQFSIYARYLVNATGLLPMLPQLKNNVPPLGKVRVLKLTDDQWAGMHRYYGQNSLPAETRPSQLMLFTDENSPEDEPF